MNYSVRWRRRARNELADIWLAATDRAAVTAAAHRIDQLQSRDPVDCSESRDRDRRVAFVGPLTVFFRIVEDDKKVLVVTVLAKKY